MTNPNEIPSQIVIELTDWLKAMSDYKRKHMLEVMKFAGKMDLSLLSAPITGRQAPICSECESDDVHADSHCQWNADLQEWEVASVYDKGGWCDACGAQDIRFDWVDIA